MPPACPPLAQVNLQHEAEHPAALPVRIPDALWTRHQGVRVVAELSRPPSTSCPESAHVKSQQSLLGFQPRNMGSEQPARIQTQGEGKEAHTRGQSCSRGNHVGGGGGTCFWDYSPLLLCLILFPGVATAAHPGSFRNGSRLFVSFSQETRGLQ